MKISAQSQHANLRKFSWASGLLKEQGTSSEIIRTSGRRKLMSVIPKLQTISPYRFQELLFPLSSLNASYFKS